MKKVLDISISKNTSNTTKEVETMIRKAETLKSLDELNLSARTKTYLNSNFGSIEDIIWEGRVDAYEQDLGIQLRDKAPKWKSELISALINAGFIRPTADFLMTFRINALYRIVYEEWGSHFNSSIGQLSNELYEEFKGLSDETIEEVKVSLRNRLTEKEYKILCLRFGLDYTGMLKDLETVGRHFYITRERVRQYEAKALRKLKHPMTTLPAIFEAPSDLEETAETLYAELEELYESPVFKRANEITWELEHMKKAPFKYTCKCLKAGALDDTFIDELKLSVRAYNCLKRAGIFTISDIINLPNDDWFKIRNLGRKALEEVVEKMHSAGYEDFNVDIPSTLRVWPSV